jgi:hypothetical protein
MFHIRFIIARWGYINKVEFQASVFFFLPGHGHGIQPMKPAGTGTGHGLIWIIYFPLIPTLFWSQKNMSGTGWQKNPTNPTQFLPARAWPLTAFTTTAVINRLISEIVR